jgi:predicted HTH transcriptional regulator
VTIEDLNQQTVFTDRQYVNEELKEMFFKLDLIQSYGSGVRRAKKAMEDNKSPKLVCVN